MKYKTNWLSGILAPMLMFGTPAMGVQSDLVCSNSATMFLDRGALFAMGDNIYGTLIAGTTSQLLTPVFTGQLNVRTMASVRVDRTVILYENGTAVLNGRSYVTYNMMGLVPFPATNIIDVAINGQQVYYITANGDAFVWSGEIGAAGTLLATGVKSVAGGSFHAVLLFNDGHVATHGTHATLGNMYGQLGNGTLVADGTLQHIVLSEPITEIKATNYATWARSASGLTWAWGQNSYGQFATGDTVNRLVPFQVPLPAGTAKVVPFYGSTAAILQDGTVKMIGWHNYIDPMTSYNVNYTGWDTMPIGKASNGCTGSTGAYMFRRPEFQNEVAGWGGNSGKLGDGTMIERHQIVSAFYTPVVLPEPVVVVAPVIVAAPEPVASAPAPTDTAIALPFNPETVPSGSAAPVPTVVEVVVTAVVDAVVTVIETVTNIVTAVVDAVVAVITPTPEPLVVVPPPPVVVPEPVVVVPPPVVTPPPVVVAEPPPVVVAVPPPVVVPPSVVTPPPPPIVVMKPTHENNGYGNGDQAAPGKSGSKNHAENDEHGDDHGDHDKKEVKKVEVKKVEVKSAKKDDSRRG